MQKERHDELLKKYLEQTGRYGSNQVALKGELPVLLSQFDNAKEWSDIVRYLQKVCSLCSFSCSSSWKSIQHRLFPRRSC